MPLTRYQAKKVLLAPRTAFRRHRMRDQPDRAKRMLELHHYGRPMQDFMGATVANPDILVDFDVDASSVVLDVGAFHGHWAARISQRYRSRIYAFEPSPAGFRNMVDNLVDHPNVTPLPYGLGGEDLVATLSRRGPGSTIYGEDAAVGADEIEIRDAARALEELTVDAVDLLKVNIEGGEYDLLDRLVATGWLPRIEHVLVQFHEWHPKAYARRRAARRNLARTHDEVWNYPWVWEYWRRRV